MKRRTRRRNLLTEAAGSLLVAWLAVKLVSASKLVAWASRPPRRPQRFADPELPTLVPWAIDTVGSRLKVNPTCLTRALAAQSMLRRRGIASSLCLGVARDGEALAAHAWIELAQSVIIGATDQRYSRIVEFGGAGGQANSQAKSQTKSQTKSQAAS